MSNLYKIVLRGTDELAETLLRDGSRVIKNTAYMHYFLLILIFFFQKCVYVYAVPVGAVNILRHSQILADSSIEKVPRRWATFKKDAIRFSATVPSVTGTSTKRTSSCAGVSEGIVVSVESVGSILLEYMCMFLCDYFSILFFMVLCFLHFPRVF